MTMPAKSETIYARLCAAKGHTLLASELRSLFNLTGDQLNHMGDRLKRFGAVTVTRESATRWRWTATPGINVADKRGTNRAGVCSPHSRRNLRLANKAAAAAHEARLEQERREQARREATKPIRSHLKHPLDIAWYNHCAAMNAGG